MDQPRIFPDKQSLAEAAAHEAVRILKDAIGTAGKARLVAATGASQLEFLAALTSDKSVDWPRVELFHLDEYIGLPHTHPASFAKYIRERIIIPTGITRYYLLDGTRDPREVTAEAGRRIREAPVDLALVGIGENGHLAFNDPPADFDTTEPYIVVWLDEACRRQQVGEGWFATVADVPQQAISMSVQQILAANQILCIVPDRRKAQAVRDTVEGPITPLTPASILRTHARATLFLDKQSASLLQPWRALRLGAGLSAC
jgi:glucosamine-6-phosphate deaminase